MNTEILTIVLGIVGLILGFLAGYYDRKIK